MAKDDYNTLVFKILLYYYGCLKRKYVFDVNAFYHAISKDDIDESYLTDIMVMLGDCGYLNGVKFSTAWGQEKILLRGFDEFSITPKGIEYLQDNNAMKKICKVFAETTTPITSLIKLVLG